ncbi:methionine aminopeptidase [Janibacter sp. DB-40]|uniref:methionine aminopeptidase n=1 Tax=Janibacter sp. DB-40 TaxID=3028808 RepID=UPI0024049572|nr:methionine aminopeptidase [Janibacter sp. DB-40]
MAYWYNIETRQVETDENRSQNADVMGPYETEAEAAAALQIAREKTEKWDEEERREREWREGGA